MEQLLQHVRELPLLRFRSALSARPRCALGSQARRRGRAIIRGAAGPGSRFRECRMTRRRVEAHRGEPQLFALDDAPSAPLPLVDTRARELITVGGLADTLFIE